MIKLFTGTLGTVFLLLFSSSIFATSIKMDIEIQHSINPVKGSIIIELYDKKAPITVKNFLDYINNKYYDGLIFHRVIDNFMIQGGGFNSKMIQKRPQPPITNEATNGLQNQRGTIAMARTGVIDSATSQFFINVKNNTFLNHRNPSPSAYGYAVFGKVVKGMDLVDYIKTLPTTRKRGMSDVPVDLVIIKKARIVK